MENKIVMEFPQENDTDLYLNVFGHSITEPLHKAGPAVKTFYLIHFVLEGEGDFYVGNAHYHLNIYIRRTPSMEVCLVRFLGQMRPRHAEQYRAHPEPANLHL